MTRRETTDRIAAALTPLYGGREARSIALRSITELSGLSLSQVLTDPSAELQIEELDGLITQLAAGRPVQYVIGRTEFCGLEIAVREGVLIPRPETEELVMWIIREQPTAKTILDVGTGSGCIALTLKHNLPCAQIFAADISDDALGIAAQNAQDLNLDITFRRADALSNLTEVFPEEFDLIVSNPPYVPQVDLLSMHPNVRDHEPPGALFVPDDDPLLFYRAIARAGRQMLRPGGALYFEIYHLFADAMREMLDREGYTATQVRNDLAGKPRMVCSRRK